jgi:hypothetical protein
LTFWGVRIQEPITALTDLLITAVCWYLFAKLRPYKEKSRVYRLFQSFFFMMGLATLLGGIFGHAFNYAVGYLLKLPGWIASMFAVMLAERSAIIHSRPLMKLNIGNFFAVINIIELITLITLTCLTLNFFFVEFHAFYGLLIVFGCFETYVYLKTKDEGAKNMLISVGISAIAAAVHISHFSIHRWFNYLDLAHIIMCVSAFVLYNGVKKITLFTRASVNN